MISMQIYNVVLEVFLQFHSLERSPLRVDNPFPSIPLLMRSSITLNGGLLFVCVTDCLL